MKYTKIFLAAALALTMTACSDTNTAEVTTIPDVETTESVITASEETTAETEETTTAEATTVSETEKETSAETTAAETSENEDSGILDLSNYSGNFYDWELVEDMTVYDKSNFPVGEDVIERAIEAVRKSENFNKQREDFEANEHIDDEKKKAAFDENGEAIINFNSGVYEDFDGDGKKEAFIVLESYLSFGSDKYIYTVFANSDGVVEFMEEHSGWAYCELKGIRYNGFMHLYIHSGAFASIEELDIYAVENSIAVPVWNCGEAYDIEKKSNSIFLYGTATKMVEGYSLFFWNDELKKYCALTGEEIDNEDMPQISEIKEGTYFSNFGNEFIGGKYYNLSVGDMNCQTYIKVNGEFVESEIGVRGDNSARIINYVAPIPVKGINIDEAESKAIPIT